MLTDGCRSRPEGDPRERDRYQARRRSGDRAGRPRSPVAPPPPLILRQFLRPCARLAIDAGTIDACAGLDPGKRYRLVIAANNLYHDYETTRRLGAMAAREATRMGRRVAVVAAFLD